MKIGINCKDVQRLIDELKDENGFISKSDFQKRIDLLKEIKVRNIINNRIEIIQNITRYQRGTKSQIFSYNNFVNKCLDHVITYKPSLIEVEIYYKKDWGNENLIEPHNFVCSFNDLMTILNVSKPTIYKWSKLGVIFTKPYRLRLKLKEKELYSSNDSFYDLDEIKKQMKALP